MLQAAKEEYELINLLDWISTFIWLVPILGSNADIWLNVVILILNAEFSKNMQRLLEFFNNKANYRNEEFFMKSMADKYYRYREYDMENKTNIRDDPLEQTLFERNNSSVQMNYSGGTIFGSVIYQIPVLGWLAMILINPLPKILFLINLIFGLPAETIF